MKNLLNDGRPIESAWTHMAVEDGDLGATVGHNGVTKIVPYTENGQMAAVVWLAVYAGDTIWKRLNAAHMAEITYKKPQPPAE